MVDNSWTKRAVERRMNVRIALRNEGEMPVFVSIHTNLQNCLAVSCLKVIYTLDEKLTNYLETVKGFRGFTCMCIRTSSHK